jgi:hypothetical protein
MSPRRPFQMRVDLGPNPPDQIVYEVHIEPPVKHAAHYIGRSRDGGVEGLQRRLAQHGGPEGARLLQVARQRGSTWRLVRTWTGDGRKERQLKTRSGALYCPECTEHPMEGGKPPRAGAKYLTRRQRAEQQQQQIQEKAGRDPDGFSWAGILIGRGGWEMTDAEMERAIPHIEALEAGWLREKREREMTEAEKAGAETAAQLITAQADAGMHPGRIAERQEDLTAGLLSDAAGAEGVQFARGYDWTAQALVCDLKEAAEGREPQPLPRVLSETERARERAPVAAELPDGTPHPQLAEHGWEVQGGIYQRTGQARVRDMELEAG